MTAVNRIGVIFILAALHLVGIGLSAASADTGHAAWWARDKPRVFVARSPSFRQGMTSEHIREIAETGFNVFCHRWFRPSHDGIDTQAIERKIALCEDHNLYYMSWMRGSIHQQPQDPHMQMVWQDGTVQQVHSPLSPVLWQFLENGLTYLAELSVDTACVGAFLDFENYAPNKRGNLYHPSYDRHTLSLFSEARGINAPPDDLAPGEGPQWLASQGLQEPFIQWQREAFRSRARDLRGRLDAINPAFQVGVYVIEGMTAVFVEEMATQRAPVILAPAATYGKASPLLDQAEALEANQMLALQGIASARQRGYPFLYLAGVMPGYRGSDPEFNAKNLTAVTEVADGYWLWFGRPRNGNEDEWHRYMAWMKHANNDIVRNRYQLHREPRMELEPQRHGAIDRQTDLPQVGIYGSGGGADKMRQLLSETGDFETHMLEAFDLAHLGQFDLVILQNFNVPFRYGSRVHQTLQAYVRDGGCLLISHNTLRHLESPFPDIAVRDYPQYHVSNANQVLDRRMVIQNEHPALPQATACTRYLAGFVDHIIHKPGPHGTVLVANHFDEAVYVVGRYGQGRVAFAGCHFGYGGELLGTERDIFLSLTRWLTATRR